MVVAYLYHGRLKLRLRRVGQAEGDRGIGVGRWFTWRVSEARNVYSRAPS
jgi:hypothetical protein